MYNVLACVYNVLVSRFKINKYKYIDPAAKDTYLDHMRVWVDGLLLY